MADPPAFQPFAVETKDGPHVTMQAGALHAGRYWTSSSRSSRKVREMRKRRYSAVVLTDGATVTIAAGNATVLDPLHPLNAAEDPLAVPAVGPALVRLGLAYPDQVAGYVRSFGRVPSDWWPVSRVLLVVQPTSSVEVVGGAVTSCHGAFDRPPRRLRASRWKPDARPQLSELPGPVALLAVTGGPCAIGLMTGEGVVAMPGSWSFDDGVVTVGRDLLAQVAPRLPGLCCVTLDRSDDQHPDRKSGVMLRGHCALVARDADVATLAVRVERTTYWDGFETSTAAA